MGNFECRPCICLLVVGSLRSCGEANTEYCAAQSCTRIVRPVFVNKYSSYC